MSWKYTFLLLGILAFTSTALGQARTRETEQEVPGSVIDIDTESGKERDEISEESGSGRDGDDEDENDDDVERSSGSGSGAYATEEIERTTSKTTTSKPLTPCENLREASKHLLGNYIPRCTENGDYAAMQCRGYPGTGRCWCSDRNGAEIPGTAIGPPDVPDCKMGTNLFPCAFKIVQHVRNPMYGSYRPRCKVNGDYDDLQCHENVCFCVTRDGEEIPGTTVLRSSGIDENMCNEKATDAPVIKPVHVVTVKAEKPGGIIVNVDQGYSVSPDNKDLEVEMPDKGTTDDKDMDDDSTSNDTGEEGASKSKMATTYIMAKPGLLAAIIGGAVVGLLCAILLVMFIVYRMRKKDEGSYALDEPRKKSAYSPINTSEKEYYA